MSPTPFAATTPLSVRILPERILVAECAARDCGDAYEFLVSDEFHYGEHVDLPCTALTTMLQITDDALAAEADERRAAEQEGIAVEHDDALSTLRTLLQAAINAEFTHVGADTRNGS